MTLQASGQPSKLVPGQLVVQLLVFSYVTRVTSNGTVAPPVITSRLRSAAALKLVMNSGRLELPTSLKTKWLPELKVTAPVELE